jgi:hypothetical protein
MGTYTPIKLIPEEQQFERKDKRKKNLGGRRVASPVPPQKTHIGL